MTLPSALDRPITLAELVDAAAIDEVIKSFAEFHGVGLVVSDLAGQILVNASVPQALCEAVRERPTGLSRCEAKLREVHTLEPISDAGVPAVCDCFSGFRYQIQPLLHEGWVLGTLIFGPYLPDDRPKQATGIVQSIMAPDGLPDAEQAMGRARRLTDAVAKRVVDQAATVLHVVLHTAYARHLAAQLHLATLSDAYAELADKNKRLGEAVERMQDVDRMKSNFLATVSHELRTPLTSVIGYSEMLLEGLAGSLNEEQRDYVHTIMEKGDQLLQLISGILDVSRTEAGTLRLAREPVDIADLVGNAVSAMQPMLRRKQLALATPRPGEAPRVLGDREKIRQIVMNLLGNAIKFTPDGGRIEVALELGALARDDDAVKFGRAPTAPPMTPLVAPPAALTPLALGSSNPSDSGLGVRMRVRDSGIGIAKEKQTRIFEPFFQVDSSSTREYGGTGLGLTLVKSFVEAHGGRVWVDSDLGQGSSFTVSLPALAEDVTTYVRGSRPSSQPGLTAAVGGGRGERDGGGGEPVVEPGEAASTSKPNRSLQ